MGPPTLEQAFCPFALKLRQSQGCLPIPAHLMGRRSDRKGNVVVELRIMVGKAVQDHEADSGVECPSPCSPQAECQRLIIPGRLVSPHERANMGLPLRRWPPPEYSEGLPVVAHARSARREVLLTG